MTPTTPEEKETNLPELIRTETFGGFLRAKREAAGLSIPELAEAIDFIPPQKDDESTKEYEGRLHKSHYDNLQKLDDVEEGLEPPLSNSVLELVAKALLPKDKDGKLHIEDEPKKAQLLAELRRLSAKERDAQIRLDSVVGSLRAFLRVVVLFPEEVAKNVALVSGQLRPNRRGGHTQPDSLAESELAQLDATESELAHLLDATPGDAPDGSE